MFKFVLHITAGFDSIVLFFDKLFPELIRFCKKNKQKNKPSIDLLLSLLHPDSIAVAA